MSEGLINQEQYYNDESAWGDYQYVTLDNIINNFILMYVGDDKLINNASRYNIQFHAKRALQEFHYDSLKEIKAFEVEIGESLRVVLPEDYVNYVRISWVDDSGLFRPLVVNNETALSKSYLQDNEFEFLFDQDGCILEADTNTYSQTVDGKGFNYPLHGYSYRRYRQCGDWYEAYGIYSQRYGLETSKANINGWFHINKKAGVIDFSSDVEFKNVVIEYISDGLEYANAVDIKVHKFAEEALYNYIRWNLLNNRIGVQEYIVKRAKKDYYNARRIARARIQGLKYNELVQAMRARDKWIK